MKKKILVTGANGQLGSCLRDLAPKFSAYEFVFTDVEELDITNSDKVASFLNEKQPNWVINSAAYTAVDKAESEQELAKLLNATAVGILATETTKIGAKFVHVSTDYVFDGSANIILTEDMEEDPQSVYGATKLEGENEAKKNPKTIILRTSWLYSTYGNNFVKTMRRLGAEREEISVVSDQWGSPTSADDLALAIMTTIKKSDKGADVYGTYHFSNEGATCWADFAQQIMELSGLKCKVNSIATSEYVTAATRPAFSVMSKAKFSKTFGVVIPEWEYSLEQVINRLDKDNI
ncbi:MAG: dTDP-4-dehydrorhamnose reductase [Rikenellaceae bacterium]